MAKAAKGKARAPAPKTQDEKCTSCNGETKARSIIAVVAITVMILFFFCFRNYHAVYWEVDLAALGYPYWYLTGGYKDEKMYVKYGEVTNDMKRLAPYLVTEEEARSSMIRQLKQWDTLDLEDEELNGLTPELKSRFQGVKKVAKEAFGEITSADSPVQAWHKYAKLKKTYESPEPLNSQDLKNLKDEDKAFKFFEKHFKWDRPGWSQAKIDKEINKVPKIQHRFRMLVYGGQLLTWVAYVLLVAGMFFDWARPMANFASIAFFTASIVFLIAIFWQVVSPGISPWAVSRRRWIPLVIPLPVTPTFWASFIGSILCLGAAYMTRFMLSLETKERAITEFEGRTEDAAMYEMRQHMFNEGEEESNKVGGFLNEVAPPCHNEVFHHEVVEDEEAVPPSPKAASEQLNRASTGKDSSDRSSGSSSEA